MDTNGSNLVALVNLRIEQSRPQFRATGRKMALQTVTPKTAAIRVP